MYSSSSSSSSSNTEQYYEEKPSAPVRVNVNHRPRSNPPQDRSVFSSSGTTFSTMSASKDRSKKDTRKSQSFTFGEDIRRNVFSDKLVVNIGDEQEDVFLTVKKVQKSDETSSFLINVLKDNFLFASLSSSEIRMFVEAMTPEDVQTDEFIIAQGGDADYFYIVQEGTVEFLVSDVVVGVGEKGKSFGELALLYNCPRTASCVAKSECKLWKIDRRTFRYLMIHSTESSDKQVISVLESVPLFSGLSKRFFQKLANVMTGVSYRDKEVIIRKGEVGNTFYIIREGNVVVKEVGKRVSSTIFSNRIMLGCGQTFGERALLTGDKRSATVEASGDCDLLCLERDDFENILGPLTDLLDQARWRHILNRIPFFSSSTGKDEKEEIENVSPEILKELTRSLTEDIFSEGDIITKVGEAGDKLYIVKEGNVALQVSDSDANDFDLILSTGEIFGEHTLFSGDVNKFTAIAYSDCVLSCLDRDSAEKILTPLLTTLEHARWRRVLVHIPVIQDQELSSDENEFLLSQITKRAFKKDEILTESKDSIMRSLYILNNGKVKIKRDQSTFTLSTGSYFGDSGLEAKSGREIITFLEDSTCGVIAISTIQSAIKNVVSPKKTVKITKNLSFIPEVDINMNDLRKHKLLGKGSFGKVWLVSKKGENTPYALKVMIKQRIHKKGQSQFVINERRIMVQLAHPFIVKLYSAFQDDVSLYMLINLIQGGEVYNLLQAQENKRDIKAENIMVDNEGYCSIIDFGFAKVIENKAFTLCGTPYYLPPEMLLSKGYDKGADYWAFGVVLYEMLVGRVPFYATDEMSVYRLICSFRFSIPPYVKPEVADLLSNIFVKPKKRIGCLVNGGNDFYEHDFYSQIDWDELYHRRLVPPDLPHKSKTLDYHLEEDGVLISYNSLEVENMKVDRGIEALFAEFGNQVDTLVMSDAELEREQCNLIRSSTETQGTSTDILANPKGGCCVIS